MKYVCGFVAAAFWASILQAETSNTTKRPQIRPALDSIQLASADLTVSIRPVPRPTTGMHRVVVEGNTSFETWLNAFRHRAVAAGIRPQVLDRSLSGLTCDTDAIKRDRSQAEFSKPIWEYLDSAVSDLRIANGRKALVRYNDTLDRIEARYGVEKEVVVAVWGLETSYGTYRGSSQTIRSLATLAHDGRRAQFFETQLLAALQIVQAGDITSDRMTGSWAGAMGHTQFMPTSYLEHAVDFDGDGRRDIWSDDPTDALASAAAYLAKFGWTKGQPWAVEVRLPKGFDYASASRDVSLLPSEWAARGVRAANGGGIADFGPASILLPAGSGGVALMIFDNFSVIERYNGADAYVIGIGHLSDRLTGQGSFRASWPRGERVLSFAERKELQLRLTLAGFDTQAIDGRIGPNTINALRAYQMARGLLPDGYATAQLLERMR